jgi:hypothetical protein
MTVELIGIISIAVTGILSLASSWQKSHQLAAELTRKAEEETRHRAWDVEDRAARQAEMVAKIDANTEISVKAFDVANNVNEKIATVAASTKATGELSMLEISKAIAEMAREIANIKATGEETRRMVQLRLGELKTV